MKKILTAALVSAAAFTVSATAQAQVLVGYAAENYPPFTAKNAEGVWEGWEVEIQKALCEHIDGGCTVVEVAWDGIIPALTSRKIDAIVASMSITEERMKTINFSDKYYNTPAVLVAAKDGNVMADATDGLNIGVQVSTIHQNYAEKHFGDADIKTYSTFDEHNADLTAGRVDAVIGDSLAFSDFLASDAGQAFEVKAELSDVEVFGPGVGVGLRKGDDDLMAQFNAAIATIRADGTFDEITARHFDFDIYGGE